MVLDGEVVQEEEEDIQAVPVVTTTIHRLPEGGDHLIMGQIRTTRVAITHKAMDM